MIGIMPAASAARTPGSESSSTRQAAALAPSLSRGLEVDVRRGLSERDLVAADHLVKARQERRLRELRARAVAAGRRRHGARNRGALEPVEQFVDAGLEREAFALDDRVVGRMPAGRAARRPDRA